VQNLDFADGDSHPQEIMAWLILAQNQDFALLCS